MASTEYVLQGLELGYSNHLDLCEGNCSWCKRRERAIRRLRILVERKQAARGGETISHWVAEASSLEGAQLYAHAFDSIDEAVAALAQRYPFRASQEHDFSKYSSTILDRGPREAAILLEAYYCICRHRDSHDREEGYETE